MSTVEEVAAAISLHRVGVVGGPRLLAVHGFGSQKLMWQPVMDGLAAVFDLVIVDLPGFGESPAMPDDLPVDARGFSDVLVALTKQLGWSDFHVVGNSLGGWIALELAAMGAVQSATALCPAGLWPRTPPLNARLPLILGHHGARLLDSRMALMEKPLVKRLALGALFGKPDNVPAEHAMLHARGLGQCEGYDRTRHALNAHRFIEGRGITVPLTVVLAPRDPLIVRRQSDLSSLPTHARFESPKGWGHVPTYDDPEGVVRLVRETAGV